MPQMMPINWLMLFITFIMILMAFNILNYFNLTNQIKLSNSPKFQTNLNNKNYWKW